MGLFGRKPTEDKKAAQRSAAAEKLRRRWEIHMEKLPPATSNHPELVEMRAKAAEYDVQASRFVGAVIMGRAQGAEAPLEGMGDMASMLAELVLTHPNDKAELHFYIQETTEASQCVLEATRIQREFS